MYEVIEITLAIIKRLYRFKIANVYKTYFSLKGFDNPWVLTSHPWRSDEHILDVGAAYSPLPGHIHTNYGCEVWAVDDFGMGTGDEFWTRSRSPGEFIAQNPEVHYVVERLGDLSSSSLPKNYFDVIYSVSTLEHVPGSMQATVWKHMDALLKPGGELIHAVDIDFPSNFGLSGMLKAAALNELYLFLPRSIREKHFLVTPLAYLRLALKPLRISLRKTGNLSILNMALNPDILAEEYEHGLNRILKDGAVDFRYQRNGSLLIHLRKLS
jgi:hypothetical protein